MSDNFNPSPKLRIASFFDKLARINYVRNKVFQRDIAKAVKLDPANLSRILSGVTAPSIPTFVRLVEYFSTAVGEREVIENFAFYVLYKTS